MQDTFPQVRSLTSGVKSSLIARICGQPPLFSPEQQLLNWLTGAMVGMSILFAAWNLVIGVQLVTPLLAQALFYALIYYLGRFKRAPLALLSSITFASNILMLPSAWFANNGIDGSTFFYYLSTLLGILSISRGRWRVLWVSLLLAEVLAVIGLQFLHPEWVMPYSSLTAQRLDIAFGFFSVGAFMMGYVGVNIYNLDARQKVADALLLNILPQVVADRLKYSPTHVLAEHHASASVLFADIVEFTPLSAGLTPGELVDLLNSVFSYFDGLADKYAAEKIKTIGDCYMVAAGVPTERADHAEALTRLALEMRDYVCTHDFAGRRLSLRIGINSGPVVAGVIGHRKFAYDLWGDAVNTASRMESHGQPNAIQVTRNTYDLIKDSFICEPQGCIEVKGKGAMDTWHVVASKS